jgi:hypothetical protein
LTTTADHTRRNVPLGRRIFIAFLLQLWNAPRDTVVGNGAENIEMVQNPSERKRAAVIYERERETERERGETKNEREQ